MATLKINRQEFERHIKITDEIIAKIGLFGTPLEKITQDELEIEILPNRPDLLSFHGFLRSFQSFIGKNFSMDYKIRKSKKEYIIEINQNLDKIRPFISCAIVKNLALNNEKIKEIVDLQEKLHSTLGRKRKKFAIGIYPLDKIEFPIKYEAMNPEKIKFIPLGEKKEFSALEILKEHLTGKEYAPLLEGLTKFPIFRDSKNRILSMPPIINNEETGKVNSSTTKVFVECTGFDQEILKRTLNIIVACLSDMGGEIYAVELHYKNKKEKSPNFKIEKIKLSLENTNKILGLNLKEKDLINLMPKMGYIYNNQKAEIPPWRIDIMHERDIIGDIAIAYGYDKIIAELPNISAIGEESKESRIKSKISEILIGLGLIETSSHHLIRKEEAQRIKNDFLIELEDSKTEYKYLRSDLITSSLRILSENKDSEYPQKIFEIGAIFKKNSTIETGIEEKDSLIIAITPGNFTEIKRILSYFSRTLEIAYNIKESTNKILVEGRTGEIIINNKPIGHIGEVHPRILQLMNIKMPISILEISLEEIYDLLG